MSIMEHMNSQHVSNFATHCLGGCLLSVACLSCAGSLESPPDAVGVSARQERANPQVSGTGQEDAHPGEADIKKRADSFPAAAFRDDRAGRKYGFIDRQGKVVLQPQYDYADDFVDGLAVVGLQDEQVVIGPTGSVKYTVPRGARAIASEGRVWFVDAKEHWGLMDERGRVLLVPQFDKVEPFSEEMAAVNFGAVRQDRTFRPKSGGKWGYVNREGQTVIPVQFESAAAFSDGLARVEVARRGGTRFIDRSGKVVVELAALDFHSPGDYREGLAPVRVSIPGREANFEYTDVIDRQGKRVFTVKGYAHEFHEGMAAFKVHPKGSREPVFGFVNKQGTLVIEPQFADARSFREGLAAVRIKEPARTEPSEDKSGTWGFIDKSGKYRIAPQFKHADSFRNGVARVHAGGRFVVSPHLLQWIGGEWWLINTKGEKLKSWQGSVAYMEPH